MQTLPAPPSKAEHMEGPRATQISDLDKETGPGNMVVTFWSAGSNGNQLEGSKRFDVLNCEPKNTTAKNEEQREKRTHGSHMRLKRAEATSALFWSKMLKSVYKYASLTVKHVAAFYLWTSQKLVRCQQQGCPQQCQRFWVSGGGKTWEHMAALNRSLDHFTCPQRAQRCNNSQNVRVWSELQGKHRALGALLPKQSQWTTITKKPKKKQQLRNQSGKTVVAKSCQT